MIPHRRTPTNFRICDACDLRVEWSVGMPAPEGWGYRYGLGKLCPDCLKEASRARWTARRRRGFCLTRALAWAGLLFATLALCRAASADLPADPFQRTATKALRGEFGKLTDWQREGYARGLKQGVTASYLFHVSAYDPESCPSDKGASGEYVSLRMAASNTIPQRSWIWTEKYGIRQVLDTGSKRNDRKARAAGCDHWVDYFFWCNAQALRVGRTRMAGAVIAN